MGIKGMWSHLDTAWIYNIRGKEIPGSDKVGDKAEMVLWSHTASVRA